MSRSNGFMLDNNKGLRNKKEKTQIQFTNMVVDERNKLSQQ